jgi:hypothetical protein
MKYYSEPMTVMELKREINRVLNVKMSIKETKERLTELRKSLREKRLYKE